MATEESERRENQGIGGSNGSKHQYERIVGSRCPLRPPDKALEPKMKPYMLGPEASSHHRPSEDGQSFRALVYCAHGRRRVSVLFIGTKNRYDIVEESEYRMFNVVNRWLGGTRPGADDQAWSSATKELESMKNDGSINRYTKKEIMKMEKELLKLEKNLGGIKNMDELPGAVFIVDPKKETIAVKEVRKLRIPLVAIADTNCDPDDIDYIVPGNDDAIRAIRLITSKIADACIQGHNLAEERLRAEADAEKEEEEEKPEEIVPTQEERKGPEVVFVSRKEEAEKKEDPREEM
jgi:small subunit ribosomal protein S2